MCGALGHVCFGPKADMAEQVTQQKNRLTATRNNAISRVREIE
jgi:hypothetical protein